MIEHWQGLVSPGLHVFLESVDDFGSDEELLQERRLVVTRWMDFLERSQEALWEQRPAGRLTDAQLHVQLSLDAALNEGIAAARMVLSVLTAAPRARPHLKGRAERIRQAADLLFETAASVAAAEHDRTPDGRGPDELGGALDPPSDGDPG